MKPYDKTKKTPNSLYTTVSSLVESARSGDQNAMAIIALVRDNALAGNQRAQRSATMMADYIKRNPVSNFGAEYKEPDQNFWASISFANAEPLNDDAINSIAETFTPDSDCFLEGVKRWRCKPYLDNIRKKLDAAKSQIVEIGRVIGQARAIQVLRQPNSLISGYNPMAGWELGE